MIDFKNKYKSKSIGTQQVAQYNISTSKQKPKRGAN